MRGLYVGFVAVIFAGCGNSDGGLSSADESIVTVPAAVTTTVPTTTTTTTTTTAPPPPTTEEPPSTPPPGDDESVTVRVTERQPGVVYFEVTDTSGRNLTLDAPFPAPTLDPRIIYVKALHPAGSDGLPNPTAPANLNLTGTYRDGREPDGCNPPSSDDWVNVCVGFPLMGRDTPGDIGFRDIANHAVDISRVLDVILRDSSLVGVVDTSHVSYSGVSMGAISGFFLVHPDSFDPRIASMDLTIGFAPYWNAQFSDPANWNRGPKIMMRNSMDDTIITYELAQRTFNNAQSDKVTLISYFGGGHSTPYCEAAQRYFDQWQDHVRGGPAPDPGVFAGSNCAALGVQPGGTTGDGAAAALAPG